MEKTHSIPRKKLLSIVPLDLFLGGLLLSFLHPIPHSPLRAPIRTSMA